MSTHYNLKSGQKEGRIPHTRIPTLDMDIYKSFILVLSLGREGDE